MTRDAAIKAALMMPAHLPGVVRLLRELLADIAGIHLESEMDPIAPRVIYRRAPWSDERRAQHPKSYST